MAKRHLSEEEIERGLGDPGFTPPRTAIGPLLDRLGTVDEKDADPVARALARCGVDAARAAIERFDDAVPPLRHRLCRLAGRVAATAPSPELRSFLLGRLDDPDPRTRRHAIAAVGRVADAGAREALLRRWRVEDAIEQRRALAEALGKTGGAEALDLLRAERTEDPAMRRVLDTAILRLERGGARAEASRIRADRPAPEPIEAVLHCREGLETFVADELGGALAPRVSGPGRVRVTLTGPPADLFRSRCALRFGFPLPAGDSRDPERAVVDAMRSERSARSIAAWTEGPVRYRIEWASAGHRRAMTMRVARAVAAARPDWINDPRESIWEVVVEEGRAGVRVELWPRGLPDPRFTYRRAQLPASSHPTIAAALARVGGVRTDDVVWDPFAGAGTELVERARLGPFRALFATDSDPRAIEAARTNLRAAGVAADALTRSDALAFRPPEAPTLVITNPPMGRRLLDRRTLEPLYDAFLDHVARTLANGGRLAWISPLPDRTLRRAGAAGLRVALRALVDMGGFRAEMQVFEKRSGGDERGARPVRAR